ncbi:transmembrane protein, putative [Bodo saltans]|uniref:Transmembrane protein, putative n=1 Tax=Bodo saltans TaxID=75058 RepID=A0A0S4JC39_BODSA|nr:transmembrane protein, putative [Bodo saltans]|eukprot:CUG87701.1 transmembrane protein, putative [Bodo saltans]
MSLPHGSVINSVIIVNSSPVSIINFNGNTTNVTVIFSGQDAANPTATQNGIQLYGQRHENLNITMMHVILLNNTGPLSLIELWDDVVIAGEFRVVAEDVRIPYTSGVVRGFRHVLAPRCRVHMTLNGVTENAGTPPAEPWANGFYPPLVWLANASLVDSTSLFVVEVLGVNVYYKESLILLANITTQASSLDGANVIIRDVQCTMSCALIKDQYNLFRNLSIFVRDSKVLSASTRFAGTAASMILSFLSTHIGMLMDIRNTSLVTAVYRINDTAIAIQSTACTFSGVVMFMENCNFTSLHTQPPFVSAFVTSIGVSLLGLGFAPTQLDPSILTSPLGDDSAAVRMQRADADMAQSLMPSAGPRGLVIVLLNCSITNGGIIGSSPIGMAVDADVLLSTIGNTVVWAHQSALTAVCGATNQVCNTMLFGPLDQSHVSLGEVLIRLTSASSLTAINSRSAAIIQVATARVRRFSLHMSNSSTIEAVSSPNGTFLAGLLITDVSDIELFNVTLDTGSSMRLFTPSVRPFTLSAISVVASIGVSYLTTNTTASMSNEEVKRSIAAVFYVNILSSSSIVVAAASSVIAADGFQGVAMGISFGNVTQIALVTSSSVSSPLAPPVLPWSSVFYAMQITFADSASCTVDANTSGTASCVLISDVFRGGFGATSGSIDASPSWLDTLDPTRTLVLTSRAAAVSVASHTELLLTRSTSSNSSIYSVGFVLDMCNLCSGPLSLLQHMLTLGFTVQATYVSAQLLVDSSTLSAGMYLNMYGNTCGGTVGMTVAVSNSLLGNGLFANHAPASGLCAATTSITPPIYPVPVYASYIIHYNATFSMVNISQRGIPHPAEASFHSWIFIIPLFLYQPGSVAYDGLSMTLKGAHTPIIQTAYALVAIQWHCNSRLTTIVVESVTVNGIVPVEVFPDYGLCGAVGLLSIAQTSNSVLSISVKNVTVSGEGDVISRGVSVDNVVQPSDGTGLIRIAVENSNWVTSDSSILINSESTAAAGITIMVLDSSMTTSNRSSAILISGPSSLSNLNMTVENTTLEAATDTSLAPACVCMRFPLAMQLFAMAFSQTTIIANGTNSSTSAGVGVWLNSAGLVANASIVFTNNSILRACQGIVLSEDIVAANVASALSSAFQSVEIQFLNSIMITPLTSNSIAALQTTPPRRGVWLRGVRILHVSVSVADSIIATEGIIASSENNTESWRLVDVMGNASLTERVTDVNIAIVRCQVNVVYPHTSSGSGLVWIGEAAQFSNCEVAVQDSSVTFVLDVDSDVIHAQDGYQIYIGLLPANNITGSNQVSGNNNITTAFTNSVFSLTGIRSCGVMMTATNINGPPVYATMLNHTTIGGTHSLTCGKLGSTAEGASCRAYSYQGPIVMINSSLQFSYISSGIVTSIGTSVKTVSLLASNDTRLTSCSVMISDVAVSSPSDAISLSFGNIIDSVILRRFRCLPPMTPGLTSCSVMISDVAVASPSDAISLSFGNIIDSVILIRGSTNLSGGVQVREMQWSDSALLVLLGPSSSIGQIYLTYVRCEFVTFVVGGFDVGAHVQGATSRSFLVANVSERCASGDGTSPGGGSSSLLPSLELLNAPIMMLNACNLNQTFIGMCEQRYNAPQGSSQSIISIVGEMFVPSTAPTAMNNTIVVRDVTITRSVTTPTSVYLVTTFYMWFQHLQLNVSNVTFGTPAEAQSGQSGDSFVLKASQTTWDGGSFKLDGLMVRTLTQSLGAALGVSRSTLTDVAISLQRSVMSLMTVIALSEFSNLINSTITIQQSRFVNTNRLRMIELLNASSMQSVTILWNNGTVPADLEWMNSIDYVPAGSSTRVQPYFSWTDPTMSIVDRWVNVLDGSYFINVSTTIKNVACVVKRFGLYFKDSRFTSTCSVELRDCRLVQTNGTIIPLETSTINAFNITLYNVVVDMKPDLSDISNAFAVVAVVQSGLNDVVISMTNVVVTLLPAPITVWPIEGGTVWSVVAVSYSDPTAVSITLINTTAYIGNATIPSGIKAAPMFAVAAMVSFVQSTGTPTQIALTMFEVNYTVMNVLSPASSIVLWSGNDCNACSINLSHIGYYLDTRPVVAASLPVPLAAGGGVFAVGDQTGFHVTFRQTTIFISCGYDVSVLQYRGAPSVAGAVATSAVISWGAATAVDSSIVLTAASALLSIRLIGYASGVLLLTNTSLVNSTFNVTGLPNVTIQCVALQTLSVLPKCGVLVWRTPGADLQYQTANPSEASASASRTVMNVNGTSWMLIDNVTAVTTLPQPILIGGISLGSGCGVTLRGLSLSVTSNRAEFLTSTCASLASTPIFPYTSDGNVLFMCAMIYLVDVTLGHQSRVLIENIVLGSPHAAGIVQMMPLGLLNTRLLDLATVRIERVRLSAATGNIAAAFRCVAVSVQHYSTLSLAQWDLNNAPQRLAAVVNVSSVQNHSLLSLDSIARWTMTVESPVPKENKDPMGMLWTDGVQLLTTSELRLVNVSATLQHGTVGGQNSRSIIFLRQFIADRGSRFAIDNSVLVVTSTSNLPGAFAFSVVAAVYMQTTTFSLNSSVVIHNSTLQVTSSTAAATLTLMVSLCYFDRVTFELDTVEGLVGGAISITSSQLISNNTGNNGDAYALWFRSLPDIKLSLSLQIRDTTSTLTSCNANAAFVSFSSCILHNGPIGLFDVSVTISARSASNLLRLTNGSALNSPFPVELVDANLYVAGGTTTPFKTCSTSSSPWGEVAVLSFSSLSNIYIGNILLTNVSTILMIPPNTTIPLHTTSAITAPTLYWSLVALIAVSSASTFTDGSFLQLYACHLRTQWMNSTETVGLRAQMYRVIATNDSLWGVLVIMESTISGATVLIEESDVLCGSVNMVTGKLYSTVIHIVGGTHGGASMMTMSASCSLNAVNVRMTDLTMFASPLVAMFSSLAPTALSPTSWTNTGIILHFEDNVIGDLQRFRVNATNVYLAGHEYGAGNATDVQRNWWLAVGQYSFNNASLALKHVTTFSSLLTGGGGGGGSLVTPGLLLANAVAAFADFMITVENTAALGALPTGLMSGGLWSQGGVTIINSTITVPSSGGVLVTGSRFASGAGVSISNSVVMRPQALTWWGGGATAELPSTSPTVRPLRLYCSTSGGANGPPIQRLRHVLPSLYYISPSPLENTSASCPGYLPSISDSFTATSVQTMTLSMTVTKMLTDTADVTATTTRVDTATKDVAVSSTNSRVTASLKVTKTLCSQLTIDSISPSSTLYDVFTGAVSNFTFVWSSSDGVVPTRVLDVSVVSSWGTFLPTSIALLPPTWSNNHSTEELVGSSNVGALHVQVTSVPVVRSFLNDVTVTLQVDVFAYCSKPTVSVVLQKTVLPVPEPARTTGQVAAVVGVVGAAAGVVGIGGAVQRSMLMLQLSVCEFSLASEVSISDSPTQLGFGDEENYYIRGTVVGDLLLIVGFVVLTVICTEALSRYKSDGISAVFPWDSTFFLEAWGKHTRMPGMLIAPLSILLQPMVSNSISLIAYPVASYDLAIGVIGVVAIGTLCVVLLLHGLHVVHCLSSSPYHHRRGSGGTHGGSTWPVVWIVADNSTRRKASFAQYILTPLSGWVPHRSRREEGRAFLSQFGHIFQEFRDTQRWFAVCDLSMSTACGVISALKPTTESGCDALTWVALALTALYAVVVAVLRPCNAAIGNINGFANAAANVVCAGLIVSGLNDASDIIALAFTALNVLLSLTGLIALAFKLGIWKFVEGDDGEKKRQQLLPLSQEGPPPPQGGEQHSRSDRNVAEGGAVIPMEELLLGEVEEMGEKEREAPSSGRLVKPFFGKGVKGYARRPVENQRHQGASDQRRDADGGLLLDAFLRPLDDVGLLSRTTSAHQQQSSSEAFQMLMKCNGTPPRSAAEQRRRLQVAVIAAVCASGLASKKTVPPAVSNAATRDASTGETSE